MIMEEKGFVLARIGFEMQELRTMRLEEKFQIKSFTLILRTSYSCTRERSSVFSWEMCQVWIIGWRMGDGRSAMSVEKCYLDDAQWGKVWEMGEVLFGRCASWKWDVRCWDIFPQSSTTNQPVVDFHNNGLHFPCVGTLPGCWRWWHWAATTTTTATTTAPNEVKE